MENNLDKEIIIKLIKNINENLDNFHLVRKELLDEVKFIDSNEELLKILNVNSFNEFTSINSEEIDINIDIDIKPNSIVLPYKSHYSTKYEYFIYIINYDYITIYEFITTYCLLCMYKRELDLQSSILYEKIKKKMKGVK